MSLESERGRDHSDRDHELAGSVTRRIVSLKCAYNTLKPDKLSSCPTIRHASFTLTRHQWVEMNTTSTGNLKKNWFCYDRLRQSHTCEILGYGATKRTDAFCEFLPCATGVAANVYGRDDAMLPATFIAFRRLDPTLSDSAYRVQYWILLR